MSNPSISAHKCNSLYHAAHKGHAECLQMLLRHGYDSSQQDDRGLTALMLAAQYKRAECVKILLDAGAKLDLQTTTDGWTALMYAVLAGDPYCVKLLVDAGADCAIKAGFGHTALEYAAWGKVDCLRNMLNACPNEIYGPALIQASVHGSAECMTLLLKERADPNSRAYRGATALILATQHRYVNCVEILLRNGANPDLQDSCGWTALMWAAQGSVDCVNLLLDAGADYTIANEYGVTALMVARVEGGGAEGVECARIIQKWIDIPHA